jgi:glycosyltransferase involved in cell wall biosynthesis
MLILFHSPNSSGGLAEYTRCQAHAFWMMGLDIVLLCPENFLQGREIGVPCKRVYKPFKKRADSRVQSSQLPRLLANAANLLGVQWRLAWEILIRRPDVVVLDSYMEYLSPLWVWPHWLLSRLLRVRYVAILHDPVRDFMVGPEFLHKLSVRLAFLPLKLCILHQHLPDRSQIPRHVSLVEAPHGLFHLQETDTCPERVRSEWGVPADKVVFLSFGFIRDNKNVDLLIRALTGNPEAVLVVMGSAQSSKNKPLQFYRDLAAELGVADRVVFREEFIPDEALKGYFLAADFIAITYDGTFHSQSGVLNIAARARRPILASSGESPLKTSVQKFRMGVFVEPDNAEAVAEGMRSLCRSLKSGGPSPTPDWDGYEQHASWERNAQVIFEAVSS